MFPATRRLPKTRCVAVPARRLFHPTAPAFVRLGEKLPHADLVEGSPGNKVNLAEELGRGRGIVIGVPAAFSPSCSEHHIPGYINSSKRKHAGKIFVVSVNDPFVMKAWAKTLDPSGSSGIRFLGDPSLAFTKALGLSFDGASIFGGHRSKRYALVIEHGVVKEAHVEPDNTGLNVSAAEKVL